MAQLKFLGVSGRHNDERHMETMCGRLDAIPKPAFKGSALRHLPLLRLTEAGGEL